MRKTKLKFIMFAMVFAVSALFLNSEVSAFCDNCSYANVPLPIIVEAGPFTITLESIEDFSDGWYQWNYKIVNTGDSTLTGLNFMAMLIPDCCNEPYIEIDEGNSSFGNLKVSAVAEGESTLFFGRYNQQAYVIKGTSVNNSAWELVTTTNNITTTTAVLKYGKPNDPTDSVEIPGPGCADACAPPPVRVEPRVQCYQFTAETDNCNKAQTWYARWAGTDPCAVEVWVAEPNEDGILPTCDDWPTGFVKPDESELGDIKITIEDSSGVSKEQVLTEALTNNSQCNEGWLRFTDPETNCNLRCYYSGGRRYCY